MQKYICTTCGYVHDPAIGDPDAGIEPGIPFGSLADDWACPKCGTSKSHFEPEDAPVMEVPLAA
jgi:rubredoxin